MMERVLGWFDLGRIIDELFEPGLLTVWLLDDF